MQKGTPRPNLRYDEGDILGMRVLESKMRTEAMRLLIPIELGGFYDIDELLPGVDAHLPIDVADMGLHRAQRYDQRRFDVLRIPSLSQ